MKLGIFVITIVTIFAWGCNTGKIGSKGNSVGTTPNDSMSYAYGMDIGKNLSAQDLEINPEVFRAGLAAGQEGEGELSDEEIRSMVMAFQAIAREKQMAAIKKQQEAQKKASSNVKVGQVAPEISLKTPEGKTINLSDLRGKYVLIDFWASWCKPCRAENPNVVRVYNEYKDKGFEILGVSLDRNKEAWVNAIEQDGLQWPHVSDLQFWNSVAAKTYGVSSIPYTVLLDKEGKVIAERLRGPSLEAKLEEIFGS